MKSAGPFVLALSVMITGHENALAGPVPRIAHTVHGKVLAVDAIGHSLTVQARRVETWMGAITAIYKVDNQKLLRQVKAGDQIMGKVFDGETALHHVQIVAVAVPASSIVASN